jgi:ABC-type proline/glycine betaine transport system permease subunit
MMALSMVIIAALIGASGLGDEILMSIAVLDAGRGVVAGLAVLVLAISLDRISKGWVARTTESRGIMSRGVR